MGRRRSPAAGPTAAGEVKAPGGWTGDGRWNEHFTHARQIDHFVAELVHDRQMSSVSPEWVAKKIIGSAHVAAFSQATLAYWLELDQPHEWQIAVHERPIEEWVVRAGRPIGEICEWRGAFYVPIDTPRGGPLERAHENCCIEGTQAMARMLETLFDEFGVPNGVGIARVYRDRVNWYAGTWYAESGSVEKTVERVREHLAAKLGEPEAPAEPPELA